MQIIEVVGRVGGGLPRIMRADLRRKGALPLFVAAALSVLAAAALTLAARADAYVYFTSGSSPAGAIGRANLDGSNVDPSFIPGAGSPLRLAIGQDQLYWANVSTKGIGRANLDGSDPDPATLFDISNSEPDGVAVDSNYLYWAVYDGTTANFADMFRIPLSMLPPPGGEREVDGEGFIALPACTICWVGSWEVRDMAVDGDHVYWSARGPEGPGTRDPIGRANLDGTGVEGEFIEATEGTQLMSIAIDDAHIYWLESGFYGPDLQSGYFGNKIGRANLDGSNVDREFLTDFTAYSNQPQDLAVDASHIYWTNRGGFIPGTGTIGRAGIDGSGVDENFITGLTSPYGIAVDALGASPNPDSDGDGILDDIDSDPFTASNAFADDGGTSGSIVDRAGLEVTIEDVAYPDGVRVIVGAGGGQVQLSVCGGFPLKLAAGSEAIVSCGSVTVKVITGAAEIVLGDGVTVVSVPEGVTAKVSGKPDGSFAVDNLGGGDVSVTVDGVATTVGPGESKDVTTWDFQGFEAPIDNPSVLNTVKAGKAIPLKWRLVDAGGSPVATLTAASVNASSLTCSLGTTPDLMEEVAAGSSGLQNLGDGYYQLNWKTPKSYARSCKALHLDLGEGITRDAYFEFTK